MVGLGSDKMVNGLTSPSNWIVEDSAKEVSGWTHGFAVAHYEKTQCPAVAMSVSVELDSTQTRP